MREGQGTPRRFTRANILGAFPSIASPYSVRDAMYRSELAALITKRRMHALMMWLRTRMPTSVVASMIDVMNEGYLMNCEVRLTDDEWRSRRACLGFVRNKNGLQEVQYSIM